MLRAILNKSWWQHTTRHQLYGHLPPITKTIQARRTRHAGHCWRSRDELISNVLLWTPAYGRAKAGRPDGTYIQQLCEDTGCSPEDLPEALNDREKWRERIRDIRASGTTWWWWARSFWTSVRSVALQKEQWQTWGLLGTEFRIGYPRVGELHFCLLCNPCMALDLVSSLSRKLAYVPRPTFGFVKLLASSGSHCTKWADQQHRQQGSSLGSFPTSPPHYPHFNRPSGFWPCVKSCLVGGSDKYRHDMMMMMMMVKIYQNKKYFWYEK